MKKRRKGLKNASFWNSKISRWRSPAGHDMVEVILKPKNTQIMEKPTQNSI